MILFYVADFDEGRRRRGAWRQYLVAGPRREQVASPLFIVSISLLPPAGTADQKEMRPSNLSYLEIICLTDSRRLRLPNTNDGYGQLEKIADHRTAFNPTRTAPVCFVRPPKPRLRREWLRKRYLLHAPSEVFQRRQQERPKTLGIEMGEPKIVRDQVACFLQAYPCRDCRIDEHVFCIGLADVECRRFLMTVPRQAASIRALGGTAPNPSLMLDRSALPN